MQAGDGMLYGTTYWGGVGGSGPSGRAGTVFKLNPDGSAYSVILTFNHSDGAHPAGALANGAGGMLYGTTVFGGSAEQSGTVFKLNTDGTGHTVLKRFSGSDGANPYCTLSVARDGTLYGSTY